MTDPEYDAAVEAVFRARGITAASDYVDACGQAATCPVCSGAGSFLQAHPEEGAERDPCVWCDGTGVFAPQDADQLEVARTLKEGT